MGKIKTILLAVLGACNVIVDIMTPIAIALFWGYFFELNSILDKIVLTIGGLASLFRAYKIGWLKNG